MFSVSFLASGENRLAKPDDIASLVIFLSSNESDFMTGQAINITGGIEKH
jgi:NAD(P)-dependent dehydrogenase (short-subunit alcohol dehydrogenase family)